MKRKNNLPMAIVILIMLLSFDCLIAWAVVEVIAWVIGAAVSASAVVAVGFIILVLQFVMILS